MKNPFILLLISLFFTNCTKTSKDSVYNDLTIDLIYQNQSGSDLLNTSTPNHFEAANIKVYEVTDGEKAEVNNPMLDYPKGFFIYQKGLQNVLRLFLADTVLLQLNTNTVDTLTCSIVKESGNTVVKKVWYNGTLKWEYGSSPLITIQK